MLFSERVLNFTINKDIVVPRTFQCVPNKKMMLTAGDGDTTFEGLNGVNIKTMTKLGYNIFCCLPPYHYNSGGKLCENLRYLSKHPELNIIICLIDLQDELQINRLANLFEYEIDVINAHDMRWYLPQNICYRLLKNNCNSHCVIIKKPIEYMSYWWCNDDDKTHNKPHDKNNDKKHDTLLTIKNNYNFETPNWKCLYNDDVWTGDDEFFLMKCYKVYSLYK